MAETKKYKSRSSKAIKMAFAELMMEEPLSKITVKAICERADYSTVAFYSNFDDKYDLAKKFVDDEITLVCRNNHEIMNTYYRKGVAEDELSGFIFKIADFFFSHVFQNRLIYEVILKKAPVDNIHYYMASRFAGQAEKDCIGIFKGQHLPDEQISRLRFMDFFARLIMFVNYWIETDFVYSSLAMASVFRDIYLNRVSGFIVK